MCFRSCICRLLYSIHHSILVHYFITQNNFFESRLNRNDQIKMIELLTEVRHHGLQCFRVSGTFSGGFHTLYKSKHISEEIHIMIRKMIHLMADYLEKNESCLVMMNKISQYSGIKLALKIIMFLWNKSNNLKV